MNNGYFTYRWAPYTGGHPLDGDAEFPVTVLIQHIVPEEEGLNHEGARNSVSYGVTVLYVIWCYGVRSQYEAFHFAVYM